MNILKLLLTGKLDLKKQLLPTFVLYSFWNSPKSDVEVNTRDISGKARSVSFLVVAKVTAPDLLTLKQTFPRRIILKTFSSVG